LPNYNFRNKDTGEEWTEFHTMAGLDEYLAANPHIEQTPCAAPFLGDPIRQGLRKPDDGFRDVLKEIKKAHPLGRGINTF
jgi:hypothetical protein